MDAQRVCTGQTPPSSTHQSNPHPLINRTHETQTFLFLMCRGSLHTHDFGLYCRKLDAFAVKCPYLAKVVSSRSDQAMSDADMQSAAARLAGWKRDSVSDKQREDREAGSLQNEMQQPSFTVRFLCTAGPYAASLCTRQHGFGGTEAVQCAASTKGTRGPYTVCVSTPTANS
eukprot:1771236-Rhodomonas_salina.1